MSKKTGITVLVAGAIAGFLVLMALGLLNQEPVTGRSGITRVGKPAPGFTLPLFGGGEFTLGESRERPVIINFWASWCPPCREEAPGLERTWRAYKQQGVTFVGVDIQDAEEDARDYINEFDITYPNGPDTDGKITVEYGVIGIPVTFFVSGDGIIVRRFVGALSERNLMEWTEELLAGVTPIGEAEGENPESLFKLDR